MFYYMDLETVNNLVSKPEYFALAIGGGIAMWPICKYVLKPLIECIFSDRERIEGIEKIITMYEKCYKKTTEERAKLATELGTTGRSEKEISDIVNNTLPLPDSVNSCL